MIMYPNGYPASYNGVRLDGAEGNKAVDVNDRDVACMSAEGWTTELGSAAHLEISTTEKIAPVYDGGDEVIE